MLLRYKKHKEENESSAVRGLKDDWWSDSARIKIVEKTCGVKQEWQRNVHELRFHQAARTAGDFHQGCLRAAAIRSSIPPQPPSSFPYPASLSPLDDSHFLLPSPPSPGFRCLCELVKPFSVMRPSAGLIFRGGGGVLILTHYPSLRECDSAVNDGERWLRRWCIVWGS